MSAIKRYWEDVTQEVFGEVSEETLEKARPIAQARLQGKVSVDELAIELYNEPGNKREGVEFEQLPYYEQALWRQSASQVIESRKIFGRPDG